MRLSVGEAIASSRLSGIELVAGSSGLHNAITGLTVLDHCQMNDAVHHGDLVMLSVEGPAVHVPVLAELIAKLADLGAAALVLRRHLVQDEVRVQADRYALPLLEARSDEQWQRVISSVQRDLLLAQIEIYERVQQIHNALTRAMVNGHNLEEIAHVLANLVHNPVVIENHRFEVLAWHNGDALPDAVRRRVLEERKVPPYVLEVLGRHGVLQRLNTEKTPFRVPPVEQLDMQARVMAPILVGNIRYGHISISESNRPLGELDLMAIEQAAALVALQFSLQHVIQERKQRLEENLVYDVLFSRDQTDATLRQRAHFLGHTFAARYSVLVADVDDFAAAIRREHWSERTIQDIKDTLKHHVRASLSSRDQSALIASGGDAFIVLYPLEADDTLETVKGYARRLQKQILDVLPSLGFSIGIGRICDQVSDLPQSHQDAQSAVSAGRAARGNHSITVYDEVGIYSLLAQYQDTSLLAAYVEKTIGRLIAYDAERDAELVKTLRAYLRAGCNKRQTAADLFVHLNTVKYRLQKIGELTGVDFNNTDDVLNLHVGLKIADMARLKSPQA